MTLLSGTRLGPYEILAPIGAGGMGEVYRARDTKLDRDVAVKVLPPHFAQDQDRLARFEREAKAVAALSHPNILAIHDFGRHDGTTYAVMELLEGNTLRERLAGGALPQRKAVEYAAQIASGLAAAHDKGIVHRDLKPDNLFVTSDGRVKILDFGLAALVEASPEDLSHSPTRERPTDPGTVLGTAGYMSPEQARGQKADARSDVFSLGCVLYEMLSGKRAFRRETTAETLTAILREDPPSLSEVTPPLSASLERMLLHCLEKRPEDRFQSARDLAFDLQAMSDATGSGTGGRTGGPMPTRGRLRWLWPVATMTSLCVAAGALLVRGPVSPMDDRRATFADIALPPGVRPSDLLSDMCLSEDGRRVAFAGIDKQGGRIWLRDVDSGTTRSLSGTQNARPVAWSRDGRRIVFEANGTLKSLDISTEVLTPLATMPRGGGWGLGSGSLNQAGDLVYAQWGLFHIKESGGDATVIALPDPELGEVYFQAPQFLPGGRQYLFSVAGLTPEKSGVYVGTLGTATRRRVLPSVSWAAFAPQGYLLSRRGPALFAQRFDPVRLELSGEPEQILEGVADSIFPTVWVGGDTVAFVSGVTPRSQFTWFDRSGREAGRVGEPRTIGSFDLSPDGTYVVFSDSIPGSLWLIDTSRDNATRRLTDGELDADPRFSRDATSVMFGSGLAGRRGLFRMSLSSRDRVPVLSAPPPMAGTLPGQIYMHDWSPDGRSVLYQDVENNVMSIPITGGEPQLIAKSTGGFGVNQAHFSPDGRWVSYNSDETGREEVFVTPFPPNGDRFQVSTGGGVQPLWRGDGREIFYLDLTGNLVSVDVVPAAAFSTGPLRVLFHTGLISPGTQVEDYEVTADGQRFLIGLPAAGSAPAELKLVFNWPALLGRQKQTRSASGPPS